MSDSKNKKAIKQHDFTKGDILKPIILFSLPVLFGDIFSALYNVVDSVVVGQFVGSGALAAVNSSFAITMVCVAIYSGFGMGSSVVAGQLLGAKDFNNLNKAISTAYIGAFFIGITMSVVGIVISTPLLKAINTPAEIMRDADIYLKIYFCGCMTQLMYYMTSGIMRGLGDSRTPMIAIIVCAILNIVLDLVFVVYFNMGCAGVAIATVISQAASAVFVVAKMLRGGYGIRFTRKTFRLSTDMLRKILKVGVPSAIQSLVNSVGLLIVQSYANSFGTNLMASNGIIQKLDSFTQLPIMAVGQTITMFNAQNLGAGHKDRVKEGNRKMMVFNIAVGAIVGVILYIGVEPLYRLFINPSDAGYAQIIEIGRNSIQILAFFYWIMALQLGYGSILRGAGAATPVMIISIACVAVRVPITYLFAIGTGMYQGLYWANNVFNTLFAVGMMLYYRFGKWEHFALTRRSMPTVKEST